MPKIPFLPALAAALLAGCGEREGAERVGNNAMDAAVPAATPANRAEAPANSAEPAAPPATGKTIPAALLGVYDTSLDACGGTTDTRLTVSAAELRFHESIGAVRRVTPVGEDAVSVEADYQGEGESWRSTGELRLSDGGRSLTVSGDGTRLDRVRCPAEAG